jgi:hypothetical protein
MSLLNVSIGGWIQYVVTEYVNSGWIQYVVTEYINRRLDTVCRY